MHRRAASPGVQPTGVRGYEATGGAVSSIREK